MHLNQSIKVIQKRCASPQIQNLPRSSLHCTTARQFERFDRKRCRETDQQQNRNATEKSWESCKCFHVFLKKTHPQQNYNIMFIH